MNTSNRNMLHLVEKIIYISVICISSIGIIISMFFNWVDFIDYPNDGQIYSLSNSDIIGELIGNSSEFMDTFNERNDEGFLVIFIILLVLSIISMILIAVFLTILGITVKNPKGFIWGKTAMIFTMIFLFFILFFKIVSNISLHEHSNINFYQVAKAPCIILVLCIINFVMIKRMKNLRKIMLY